MKVLLLDNYDSFVYNLSQALRALGADTSVVRNDAWTIADVIAHAPDAIVISPGPGRPDDAAYFGVCDSVIRTLSARVPTLGVCLGHQGIVHALGGRIERATQPMHGKASAITHDGRDLFTGLPQPFMAMRYHSLVVDPGQLPACLRVTASAPDGAIMAVSHHTSPLYGVQFHPESIGTPCGPALLENFLRLARAARGAT
jgi:anthranilate synthase/aminodeoxychorismate synthase-like glutamine amidotransferase